MGAALCVFCQERPNVDESAHPLVKASGHVSFRDEPSEINDNSLEGSLDGDALGQDAAEVAPRAPEPAPEPEQPRRPSLPARILFGARGASANNLKRQAEKEAEAAAAAAETAKRAAAEKERRRKVRALRKFVGVMAGNGLRVRKYKRGSGKSSVRVIKYDEATAAVSWGSAAESTIRLADVSAVDVEGCTVWVTDRSKKAPYDAAGFETAKAHDADFLASCLRMLVAEIGTEEEATATTVGASVSVTAPPDAAPVHGAAAPVAVGGPQE